MNKTRHIKRLMFAHNIKVVEVAIATEYYRYADDVLGMESFGASAPADLLLESVRFNNYLSDYFI
jgi:transketolase